MKHAREDYNGRVVDLYEPLILAFLMRVSDLATAIAEGENIGLEDNARRVLSDLQAVMAFRKEGIGVIAPIPDEEPVFLVRGQDIVGGATVRSWANWNDDAVGASRQLSHMARAHSAIMDLWPKKKAADLP